LTPNTGPDNLSRGYIIPIGGAEDKVGPEAILKRFVQISGGRDAHIAVIPTASELRSTGRRYEELFKSLRASRVSVLHFESRKQCEDPEELALLEKSTGIFLTGGSQLRLGTMLGGTSAARSIRLLNERGVHVAGTSAGAAFLSEHMIAYGEEGPTPHAGMVTMAPGLGLTNRIVVDQHFRQRDRLGRLLAALAFNPFAVGVGLDEDTAAFLAPDETLEVVGSGAMTIVDPSGIEYSSMDAAKQGEPVSLLGVKLHIIVRGGAYNLETRVASAAGAPTEGD